jgi:hypothetical protein
MLDRSHQLQCVLDDHGGCRGGRSAEGLKEVPGGLYVSWLSTEVAAEQQKCGKGRELSNQYIEALSYCLQKTCMMAVNGCQSMAVYS